MTNYSEWNNFVSTWQRNRDERIDKKCKEQYERDDNCFIQSCLNSVCRSFDISVPITVTPFAVPGKPTAKSAGEYEVNPCVCDNENDCLKFTITQKMNVDIPVLFGAEICFDKACAKDNGECDDEDNGYKS